MQFFLDHIWVPLVAVTLIWAIAKAIRLGG
jgi:hypothetical protein